MVWETAKEKLLKKREIFGQLEKNSQVQGRFIQQGKMKGLQRVLEEREVLLEELRLVHEKLEQETGWKQQAELLPLIRELAALQERLLCRSTENIQQAMAERSAIAHEMHKRKLGRQVRQQYTNPWATQLTRGALINEKR